MVDLVPVRPHLGPFLGRMLGGGDVAELNSTDIVVTESLAALDA